MSESKTFHWIVVIQKNHRGPFTLEEVKALIEQGIVRHNDLAMRFDPSNQKENSGWKFLWQFPELDRRAAVAPSAELQNKERGQEKPAEKAEAPQVQAAPAAAAAPAAPVVHERKGHVTDERIKQAVFAQLPRDLFEVGVPAVKAKAAVAQAAEPANVTRSRAELEATMKADAEGSFLPKLGITAAVLLLVYFASQLFSGSSSPHHEAPPAHPQAAVARQEMSKAKPKLVHQVPPTIAPHELPKARPFTPQAPVARPYMPPGNLASRPGPHGGIVRRQGDRVQVRPHGPPNAARAHSNVENEGAAAERDQEREADRETGQSGEPPQEEAR